MALLMSWRLLPCSPGFPPATFVCGLLAEGLITSSTQLGKISPALGLAVHGCLQTQAMPPTSFAPACSVLSAPISFHLLWFLITQRKSSSLSLPQSFSSFLLASSITLFLLEVRTLKKLEKEAAPVCISPPPPIAHCYF